FGGDFHGKEGPIVARRFPKDTWTAPQRGFYQACLDRKFKETEDFNHPDATGVGAFPCNNPNGIRVSTSLGYLSESRHRMNFTLRPNCTVTKLIMTKNKITNVEVESGGDIFQVEAETIILSAGSLANPQILMLSGIGPTENLESCGIKTLLNLDGVGKNLQDHPQNFVHAKVKSLESLDTTSPRLQVGLRYSSRESKLTDDMMMWMGSYAINGDYRDILSSGTSDNKLQVEVTGIQITVSLYLATSRGSVTLNPANPNGKPDVNLNLLQSDSDVSRMAEGVEIASEIIESPAMENIVDGRTSPPDGIFKDKSLLHKWLRSSTTTGNHLTSTCAMGIASNKFAVVDETCRVFGVDNLYIADASIMPETVRANTNVTTMMIGERLADFLNSKK
ncbi:MAG: GMC oxidoreductase, partial [Chloroflexota bacterium]|nr:GMC oxidoreductase [Chloroflexota bacterium]